MSAYGTIDVAKAGMILGLNDNAGIETLIVSSGSEFNYGDPVFVDQGDDSDIAYNGDSNDASLVFAGVAIVSQISTVDSVGKYEAYDAVNVLRAGKVWVNVASGQSAISNKAAYVVHDTTSDDYEDFTATSGSNYASGCYFRSNPTSDWLAILEVRGLK